MESLGCDELLGVLLRPKNIFLVFFCFFVSSSVHLVFLLVSFCWLVLSALFSVADLSSYGSPIIIK